MELIKYLWLYILALGKQMDFSPRSTKTLSFTRPHLLEDATPENLPYSMDALSIQDDMAPLHTTTNILPTCGEIYPLILDHTVISTHSYHPVSKNIQDMVRRGRSEKIFLAGPATRQLYDSKSFLANDDTEKQL